MKKTYKKPAVEMELIFSCDVMAASSDVTSDVTSDVIDTDTANQKSLDNPMDFSALMGD